MLRIVTDWKAAKLSPRERRIAFILGAVIGAAACAAVLITAS